MRLALVSCAKSKRTVKCKASQMYTPSAIFKHSYQYATRHYDFVAILSAKYGLLLPEDEIEPYNITLKTMTTQQRRQWTEKVINQINEHIGLSKIKECYFHAGKKYRQFLIPFLEKTGIKCRIPLQGLPIGKQIQWYKLHPTPPK